MRKLLPILALLICALPVSAQMAQAVSYNFSTVENPLSNGGVFTTVSDTSFTGTLKVITGNLCEGVTLAASNGSYYSGTVSAPSGTWPADQYSEITLTTWASTQGADIIVRQGAASSGTQYFAVISGANTYILAAQVTNVTHILKTTTSQTFAQGDVVRLSVTGNVLSLSRNGSVVETFTDTNNYVTAGAPGFALKPVTNIANVQTALWAGGANQAATPTFSPIAGTYTGTQIVTVTSSTSGGTIYYTTDGTTPTHASSSISNGGTVSISSSKTLKAIESVSDYLDSGTGSAAYTINTNANKVPPMIRGR